MSASGFFEISIEYGDATCDPERITLARMEEGLAAPIASYIDRDRSRILAFLDRLGSYALDRKTGGPAPDYGSGALWVSRNAPNPFAGKTSIGLELPRRESRSDRIQPGGPPAEAAAR